MEEGKNSAASCKLAQRGGIVKWWRRETNCKKYREQRDEWEEGEGSGGRRQRKRRGERCIGNMFCWVSANRHRRGDPLHVGHRGCRNRDVSWQHSIVCVCVCLPLFPLYIQLWRGECVFACMCVSVHIIVSQAALTGRRCRGGRRETVSSPSFMLLTPPIFLFILFISCSILCLLPLPL